MAIFLGDYSIHGKRASVEEELAKHGSHNQASHGGKGGGRKGGGTYDDSKFNPDDSEGEDSIEDKNPKTPTKLPRRIDDSEEEYEELDADDPKWMDDMDIIRPPKRKRK